MRKAISFNRSATAIVLAIAMVFGLFIGSLNKASAEIVTGLTGEDTWSIDTDTGEMTISGNGEMGYYDQWQFTPYLNTYRKVVKSSVVEQGVTDIGTNAFCMCENMVSTSIPSSVTKIGFYAYNNCYVLDNVKIPSSVKSIDSHAFFNCYNLKDINLAAGLETIYRYAFGNCQSLEKIWLPASLTSIGYNAFMGCSSLTDVYFEGSEQEWLTVGIDTGNDCLLNANIHYDASTESDRSYSEEDYWGFPNFSKNIPEYIYAEHYGSAFGKFFSKFGNDGANGNCLGMSSSVIMLHDGKVAPESFGKHKVVSTISQNDISIGIEDRNTHQHVSAEEWIQHLQSYNSSVGYQMAINKNKISGRDADDFNLLDSFVETIKQSIDNDRNCIISISQVPRDAHALVPIKYQVFPDSIWIYVYDSNFKSTTILTVMKDDEMKHYTSWSYIMVDGSVRNSDGLFSYLSYIPDTSDMERYLYTAGITMDSEIKSLDDYSASAGRKLFMTHAADFYIDVGSSKVNYSSGCSSNIEKLLPITETSSLIDGANNIFWVENERVSYSTAANEEVAFASDHYLAEMQLPENARIIIDESKDESVIIENALNKETFVSITVFSNDKETTCTVTGLPSGVIEISPTDEGLSIKGFKEGRAKVLSHEECVYQGSFDNAESITVNHSEKDEPTIDLLEAEAAEVIPNVSSITIDENEEYLISASVKDKYGSIIDKEVKWDIDNPAIAAVDAKGKLTGLRQGNATVTVSADNVKAYIKVNVDIPKDRVVSIKCKSIATIMDKGETMVIPITLYNKNGEVLTKSVEWSSSNPKVVSVNEKGMVKGIKAGNAVVSASVDGRTARITICVEEDLTASIFASAAKNTMRTIIKTTVSVVGKIAKAFSHRLIW